MNRTMQPEEWRLKELISHLELSKTQEHWEEISTLDPLGMYSRIPTIAATPAIMEIPELIGKLKPDGNIVLKNQTVHVTKMAIEPVWNISKLAESLHVTEDELRQCIFKWTSNKDILDSNFKIYLPPIGSTTV